MTFLERIIPSSSFWTRANGEEWSGWEWGGRKESSGKHNAFIQSYKDLIETSLFCFLVVALT